MAEGVAEVQQRPLALLALVPADDRRLDLAGAQDHVRQRLGSLVEQLREVLLEPAEQLGIADEAVLDDLGEPGAQLARRQRGQGGGVAHHELGLVEGPDQVLAADVVDAGLAADGRVHLGQQRGGHLHEGDAALVAGGGKAGEVPDHAPAQGQHGAVAGEAVGDQHIEHAGQVAEGLVGLPVRAG